ncbi:hypothetical protein SEEB0183_04010 [Salmonella enterica subsp. enterica serovar Bareilly str. CFSAN000183]|nr:hypothetical protein SEEB0183_04010 [Salmonella enterica subsp. enterica serovar Bareilly str. CFSAN000183]
MTVVIFQIQSGQAFAEIPAQGTNGNTKLFCKVAHIEILPGKQTANDLRQPVGKPLMTAFSLRHKRLRFNAMKNMWL